MSSTNAPTISTHGTAVAAVAATGMPFAGHVGTGDMVGFIAHSKRG